jgi:hypothetical protein
LLLVVVASCLLAGVLTIYTAGWLFVIIMRACSMHGCLVWLAVLHRNKKQHIFHLQRLVRGDAHSLCCYACFFFVIKPNKSTGKDDELPKKGLPLANQWSS